MAAMELFGVKVSTISVQSKSFCCRTKTYTLGKKYAIFWLTHSELRLNLAGQFWYFGGPWCSNGRDQAADRYDKVFLYCSWTHFWRSHVVLGCASQVSMPAKFKRSSECSAFAFVLHFFTILTLLLEHCEKWSQFIWNRGFCVILTQNLECFARVYILKYIWIWRAC